MSRPAELSFARRADLGRAMSERRGRVEGKVAIVTGAGSTPGPGKATGRACAITLAREGARVLLADTNPDRGEESRTTIGREGGPAARFPGRSQTAAAVPA